MLDAEISSSTPAAPTPTITMPRDAGCEVIEHPFQNYAAQAFDNLPITTPWALCLDADGLQRS